MIKDNEKNDENENQPKSHQPPFQSRRILQSKWFIAPAAVISAALLITGGMYGFTYMSTPEHIRRPAFDHYHFRSQIVVRGEIVDFGHDEFQEDYDAASCSADLPDKPIDFHDNESQTAHVHWDGMTGGEFLKMFGWNYIGGDSDTLGMRYDEGMLTPQPVTITGNLLPEVSDTDEFYVYVGDESGYTKKDWSDFLHEDFEKFFGKESRLNPPAQSSFNVFDLITAKAYAHGMVEDNHSDDVSNEDDLERLNNLIGNVVIFVQEDEPSDIQIKERLNNLEPLHESTCGG